MVIAPQGRNRGRQKATVTKMMTTMMMIRITFFFLLVINCEPFAAVVDLSLIGREAVWGVNRGYLYCVWGLWFHMTKRKGTVEKIPATPFEGSDLAVLIWIINWVRQTDRAKKESKRAGDRKTHRGETGRWIPILSRQCLNHVRYLRWLIFASNIQANYSGTRPYTGSKDGCW